jgi:hypothetical protein
MVSLVFVLPILTTGMTPLENTEYSLKNHPIQTMNSKKLYKE